MEKNQAIIKRKLIFEYIRIDALGLSRKMNYLSSCILSLEKIGKKLLNTSLIGLRKA